MFESKKGRKCRMCIGVVLTSSDSKSVSKLFGITACVFQSVPPFWREILEMVPL